MTEERGEGGWRDGNDNEGGRYLHKNPSTPGTPVLPSTLLFIDSCQCRATSDY